MLKQRKINFWEETPRPRWGGARVGGFWLGLLSPNKKKPPPPIFSAPSRLPQQFVFNSPCLLSRLRPRPFNPFGHVTRPDNGRPPLFDYVFRINLQVFHFEKHTKTSDIMLVAPQLQYGNTLITNIRVEE